MQSGLTSKYWYFALQKRKGQQQLGRKWKH